MSRSSLNISMMSRMSIRTSLTNILKAGMVPGGPAIYIFLNIFQAGC